MALVGFMGSGKSTVGALLAQRLSLPFVDLDALIEERERSTIAAIFASRGEEAFRALEQAALRRALASLQHGGVIAAGGGIVTTPKGRRLLSRATTAWLDAPFDVCYRRALGGGRPLLMRGRAAAQRLYRERRPLYALGRIRVMAHLGSAEAVASRLALKLRRRRAVMR